MKKIVKVNENSKKKYKYEFDDILKRYIVRDLRPYFIDGEAIELGCYHGGFTQQISHYFDTIYAVDASFEAINMAKSKNINNVNYINKYFEELDLSVKADNVFMIHAYEHIENRADLLDKIKCHLKPQGRLFIVVPNATAASRQIASCMGIIDYNSAVAEHEREHGHYRTFSFDSLNFELKQSGFKIIKSGGTLFKPLANYQFDLCLEHKIINDDFVDGCYSLGGMYPELAASIYSVCEL